MRQQRPPCQTGHTNYQCVRCDPFPIATAAAAPLFLYLSTELYKKKPSHTRASIKGVSRLGL